MAITDNFVSVSHEEKWQWPVVQIRQRWPHARLKLVAEYGDDSSIMLVDVDARSDWRVAGTLIYSTAWVIRSSIDIIADRLSRVQVDLGIARIALLVVAVPTPARAANVTASTVMRSLGLHWIRRIELWREFDYDSTAAHESNESSVRQALNVLSILAIGELDDDDYWMLALSLMGEGGWVLQPGSASPLWSIVMSGQYIEASRSFSQLRREMALRLEGETSRDRILAASWLSLVDALIAARLGQAELALKLVLRLDESPGTTPELIAWIWNIRSISYGKLERARAYIIANRRCIRIAEAAGLTWLAESVKLRHAHKQSWAAAEDGAPIDNGHFESVLEASVERIVGAAAEWKRHVLAQRTSYLALQYTWQPEHWDMANQLISKAQGEFGLLGDVSELARMTSERGRLFLLSGSSTRAIRSLQRGLVRRLDGGEYPRARYDLAWLGEAQAKAGCHQEAEVCNLLVLALHEQLYGVINVDKGVLKQATARLFVGTASVRALVRNRRFDEAELLRLVDDATSLGEERILRTLDLSRVKDTIVRYSAL